MSNDDRSLRSSTTRRVFLGSVAAATASSAVAGAQDDENESDDGDSTGSDGGATGAEPEIVADLEPPELPENLAIDDDGNVYASLAVTGEIRQVGPDGSESTVAQLDVGEEGILLGITVDDGVIHAALGSGEEETHGVWRVPVDEGGEPERMAALPPAESTPNGIIHHPDDSETLLVSDHTGGAIWRVTSDGAEPWVDDPLLDPDPYAEMGVGADGLAVHPDGDVFVDNLDFGGIVRVPVEDDGSAGEPEVFLQDDSLIGCDGLTFSEEGNLYVAVNAANEVVRVTPEQEVETVVSGGDLDFPADVHFGTTEETSLYICNFAFGSFLAEDATANPSLMRIDVGERGYFPRDASEDSDGDDDTDDADDADGDDGADEDDDTDDSDDTDDGDTDDGDDAAAGDDDADDGNVTDDDGGNVTDGGGDDADDGAGDNGDNDSDDSSSSGSSSSSSSSSG